MLLKLKETCNADNLPVTKKVNGEILSFNFTKKELTEVDDELGKQFFNSWPQYFEEGKGKKADNAVTKTIIENSGGVFDPISWMEENAPLNKTKLSVLSQKQLFAVSTELGANVHPRTGDEKHSEKILAKIEELKAGKKADKAETHEAETPEK